LHICDIKLFLEILQVRLYNVTNSIAVDGGEIQVGRSANSGRCGSMGAALTDVGRAAFAVRRWRLFMEADIRDKEQEAYDRLVVDMAHANRATATKNGFMPTRNKKQFLQLRNEAVARYVGALKQIGIEPSPELIRRDDERETMEN
jgi:hypothetical protein